MGGEKEGETGSLKGEIKGYMLPVKIAEKILTHFFSPGHKPLIPIITMYTCDVLGYNGEMSRGDFDSATQRF